MNEVAFKPELVDLLREIARRRIEVWLGGKNIKFRGPRSSLDEKMKERMVLLKLDLEDFLLRQPTFRFPTIEINKPDVDKHCVIQIQAGSKGNCALFGMHAITGLSPLYRYLILGLGRDYSIFGINSVDTGFKRAPISDIREMAACYADQIKSVQQSGPYFILGFSMGGLIALEVARTLSSRGEQIDLLAVFDTRMPIKTVERIADRLDGQPPWVWLMFIHTHVNQDLAKQYRGDDEFHRMSWKEKCACLASEASRHNPVLFGADCSSERLSRHFESFVALSRAQQNYRPDPYFERIVYFLAQEEATHDGKFPYLSSWFEIAKGPFELVPTPGNHVSMMFKEVNAVVLGNKLKTYLPH